VWTIGDVVQGQHNNRIHRCSTVVLLAALILVGVASALPSAAEARLFSAGSVWNAGVGGLAVDRSSPARVNALASGIEAKIRQGVMPWPGTGASTVYVVGRSQPRVPVRLVTGSWGASLKAVLARGVPIPVAAVPGSGTDAHMVIYQPTTDVMWELYNTHRDAGGWRAEWGGVMQHVSSNPGFYSGTSWPGLQGEDGWNWGATASSLPELGGLVRIDELRAGHIDHALAVDVPDACKTVFAWPAQRTDGGDANQSTCMPEGARLRLDPRVDLSKLKLTKVGRMLAVAAQRYGMVVRDKTWGVFQIDFETPPAAASNGDDDRPPYTGSNGLWDGPAWVLFDNFPWRSLQVLNMKLCTSHPCQQPEQLRALVRRGARRGHHKPRRHHRRRHRHHRHHRHHRPLPVA
jgi:hypothetical protein